MIYDGLRKGAVSARKGERLLIPINMRDGALICIGKGNPDWNYSAPHGAGRATAGKQPSVACPWKHTNGDGWNLQHLRDSRHVG